MAESNTSSSPRRTATIGELLSESTDLWDFFRRRSEVDVVDEGPNPLDVLKAERSGEFWVPEEFRVEK